jgi:hypothetical protein
LLNGGTVGTHVARVIQTIGVAELSNDNTGPTFSGERRGSRLFLGHGPILPLAHDCDERRHFDAAVALKNDAAAAIA